MRDFIHNIRKSEARDIQTGKSVPSENLLGIASRPFGLFSHIPVSDQNSQTFFPFSLPATEIQVMIVKDYLIIIIIKTTLHEDSLFHFYVLLFVVDFRKNIQA